MLKIHLLFSFCFEQLRHYFFKSGVVMIGVFFLQADRARKLVFSIRASLLQAQRRNNFTLMGFFSCTAKHFIINMQVFSKNLVAKTPPKLIMDRYDQEVQQTKDKIVTLENMNKTQYSTTSEALQYYSRGAILAVVGVVTSAITYPLSIRIVKKVFRLKDFLNVHLAALPIILNANAFVIGVTQGIINYNVLIRRYPRQWEQEQELRI